MAAALALVLPILVKAAREGTLLEILGTAAKLMRLVMPLVSDPKVQAQLTAALGTLQGLTPRPAQPEDPAMAHAARDHQFGGR